eukprot:m.1012178 g.1012178  ORF g.1012178 m.1012178 type:complete len:168 (+) comp24065_c0_seq14:1916-2419(+)
MICDASVVWSGDSAYAALSAGSGILSAAQELYDVVDFDALFTATILPDLEITHPEYKIIHRRALCTVGQWTSVKFDKSGCLGLRAHVYQVLVKLMAPSVDLVVRITAVETLEQVVDDFEFWPEVLLPYLSDLMLMLHSMACTQSSVELIPGCVLRQVSAAARRDAVR